VHPLVKFATIAERELLLHGPRAQRPFSQVSMGVIIDEFPATANETRADGSRQVASGEAAIPAKAVSHVDEMD
jgi:hypothetical protein